MFDHRRVLISTCNWDTGIVTHTHISDVVDDQGEHGELIKEHLEDGELEALTAAARKLELFPGFSPVIKEQIKTPWYTLAVVASHVFRHRSAVLDCWT